MTHRPPKRYTIAPDFDGVIHSYTSPWTTPDVIPDPPVEGAIDWLHEMVETYNVVILSTRGQYFDSQKNVMEYLRNHGYKGPDLLVTDKKVPALIYPDDRGWRFEGPGTFPTVEQITAARPWNKI